MQAQKTCRKGAIFLRVYNIGANSSWLLPLKHVKGEVHDFFFCQFYSLRIVNMLPNTISMTPINVYAIHIHVNDIGWLSL